MINLKQFFCWHTNIPISRKLKSTHLATNNEFDVSTINVYLQKGYCVKCKKRFAEVVKINARCDRKQPYDKKEKI